MQQFASGPAAAISLVGEEPPLSPVTVGRSGNAFSGAAVAMKPIPAISFTATSAKATANTRRLVLRLLGGEELELATFEDREEAMQAAAEIVAQLAAAETGGDWPEIDGRFIRPGSIASVDVLPAA